jgi:hypothetical protein
MFNFMLSEERRCHEGRDIDRTAPVTHSGCPTQIAENSRRLKLDKRISLPPNRLNPFVKHVRRKRNSGQ